MIEIAQRAEKRFRLIGWGLFDAYPKTVSNFLNYVENANGVRRYDGTFIHRSVPGFVIQGGGYAYDPGLGAFSANSAPHIQTDAPVINEFGRSNVRGTVAMAKIGGNPDSATSEWFINLADNSANLDNQNGGFTVFGQVLGNGMSIADTIAALDVVSQDIFSNLPVVDAAKPITADNLVTITKIVANPPAAISVSRADHDFGLVALGSGPASWTVTVQNIGGTDLVLGTVGASDALAAPFRIAPAGDGCSGNVLVATASCDIVVQFEPVTLGEVLESFNIPSSDAIQPSIQINLRGTGAPATPTLEVLPQTVLDFGVLGTGELRTRVVTLRNVGGGVLEPLQPVIGGVDAARFTVSADGCTGAMLNIGESCNLSVDLTSLLTGQVSAVLSLSANPVGQSAQLSLKGQVNLLQSVIDLPGALALGDTRSGQLLTALLPVTNRGADDLFVSGVKFLGADAALFSVGTECVNVPIAATSSCNMQLGFSAAQVGAYSATARILSNDPARPEVDVSLNVTVSEDGDGIPDAVEAAGPHGGDANQDGIADKFQDEVASFLDANGQFVALEVPKGVSLTGVKIVDNPSALTVPTIGNGTLDFSYGFFSFVIENVPASGVVTAKLYLPQGQSANGYFKFGRLPGEPLFFVPAHWYNFLYEPQSRTGAEFSGNQVTLHYVDGGRGDNDQQVNGRIVDPGGPAVISVGGGGSSGGGCSLVSAAGAGRRGIPVDFVLLLMGLIILRLLQAGLDLDTHPKVTDNASVNFDKDY